LSSCLRSFLNNPCDEFPGIPRSAPYECRLARRSQAHDAAVRRLRRERLERVLACPTRRKPRSVTQGEAHCKFTQHTVRAHTNAFVAQSRIPRGTLIFFLRAPVNLLSWRSSSLIALQRRSSVGIRPVSYIWVKRFSADRLLVRLLINLTKQNTDAGMHGCAEAELSRGVACAVRGSF
jgi:hypothetical protein